MFDFPGSPSSGQQFTPIAGGPTYVYQGGVWRMASGGLNAGVWIGDTAPSNPTHGMLWWESDTGNSFIYYDDGSSGQWVQFNLSNPLVDHISSSVEDMWAGFETSGRFVVNSESDDSGTDLLSLDKLGQMQLRGSSAGRISLYGAANYPIVELFNSFGGLRGGYLWLNAAGLSIDLMAEQGYNLKFGSGSTKWWIVNATGQMIVNAWTGGSNARLKVLYDGTSVEHGITIGTGQATGVAVHFTTNASTTVGTISVTAAATAYNTSSDERLKDFIGNYDPEEAIRIIRADPPREFTWKIDGSHAIGWGAQTSYAVSPELATPPNVQEGKETDDINDPDFVPWGVDQGRRTPYLWAALIGALDKIDALEARLAILEGTR